MVIALLALGCTKEATPTPTSAPVTIIGHGYYAPPTAMPTPTSATHLITKDASQLVLALTDLGEGGWSQDAAPPFVENGAQSTSEVRFRRESWLGEATYTQFILNDVAVFPSVEQAHEAYLIAKPTQVTVEERQVGDEAFFDIWTVASGQRLVFRKANVVVWLWLSFAGDIDSYARIIEAKISYN